MVFFKSISNFDHFCMLSGQGSRDERSTTSAKVSASRREYFIEQRQMEAMQELYAYRAQKLTCSRMPCIIAGKPYDMIISLPLCDVNVEEQLVVGPA